MEGQYIQIPAGSTAGTGRVWTSGREEREQCRPGTCRNREVWDRKVFGLTAWEKVLQEHVGE